MKLSDFDYSYPSELIASYPLPQRDSSRMMVLNRREGTWEHRTFRDFPDYFDRGEVLVLNNSKVFPCRLFSQKKTGGRVEVFLIREVQDHLWECLVTDSKKITEGTRLNFGEDLKGEILGQGGRLTREIRLEYDGSLETILEAVGHVPLPRYIKRGDEPNDRQNYQTIFAQESGSVAAPTAGFHFTEKILSQLKAKGVKIVFLTLHVGVGTFLPIRAERVEDHRMQSEYYEIPEETAEVIRQAKKTQNKITVVGTTSVRALESATNDQGHLSPGKGYTDKFIYPPYQFRIVDRLLTNFHQPKSTLLILVSAFAGRELIGSAYREALQKGYRLFSYGDCMLLSSP